MADELVPRPKEKHKERLYSGSGRLYFFDAFAYVFESRMDQIVQGPAYDPERRHLLRAIAKASLPG